MSANGVTIASLLVALVGLVLVVIPNWPAIIGCLLLLLYHLLDRVDGEIARYRSRFSLLGIYLDNAGHYVTASGLLVASAFGLAHLTDNPNQLWLVAALGAIASIMSRVEKHAPFQLFSQYVLDRPELADTVRQDAGALNRAAVKDSRSSVDPGSRGLLGWVRDALLLLTWFPVSVVLLLFGFSAHALGIWIDAAEWAVILVSVLQMSAYLGVEWANLAGNLGSETRRLLDGHGPRDGL